MKRISRSGVLDRQAALFVALAAVLWVADVYFRPALVRQLAATQIVFAEDLLIVLCLAPLALPAVRRLRGQPPRTLLALLIVGVGPQALATALFTWSLSFAYPTGKAPDLNVANEVYLLYLAQPIIGVLLARVVLGERRRRYFWPFAALALVGVYLIVFQTNVFAPFGSLPHGEAAAGLIVLGAVGLWGAGTVMGRYALRSVPPVDTAVLRFLIALPVLLILLIADRRGAAFSGYTLGQLPSLLGIAIIPGVVAMLLYYRALRSTPASAATIAELAYPAALFLALSLPAPAGLGAPLHPAAVVGAVALVAAVTVLNLVRTRAVATPPATSLRPVPTRAVAGS